MSFHYELRSEEQRDALAVAPLPLGIVASEPRRTLHRDIYLDTADDALRSRGIACRLRIGSTDERILSLRIASGNGSPPIQVEAEVRSVDATGALVEDSAVRRRLRALIDPALLQERLDIEVERLTRTAHAGFLRRPHMELHYDRITVRRGTIARTFFELCGHLRRGSADELRQLAIALEVEHDLDAAGGDRRERAELLMRWMRTEARGPRLFESDQMLQPGISPRGGAPVLINPELSLLAFQRRVLALAEEPATPLRERLRFLEIVSCNLDEMYMVRIPDLRAAAAAPDDQPPGEDGLSAGDRLALVERDVGEILAAQARCAGACLRAAERLGVHLVDWNALTADEQEALGAKCRDDIHPGLTPLAMTLSPGHPLPHLPHLGLSLAVVFRRDAGGRPHIAELELPGDVPRLLTVPGRTSTVIAIEEVLRANVGLLYPHAQVESAHLFRVTRGGDLDLDEHGADDLLDAVDAATGRRRHNPAVRVEVEGTMPAFVREMVLENLRREALTQGPVVAVDEVQVVEGMLDLRCLADLPLPEDPALRYAPLPVCTPVAADRSMIDAIREGDLLAHHPFEDFEATVVRFLREAADDPGVTTIKITLYRVGDPSPVVETLLAAARNGKRVVVVLELKARFEEEHNVGWARALENAGGHVVYGLVGLKVHAKVALVVRREEGRLRQYVHIGTGNYNTRSGRQYTDLSLFSAHEALAADAADLFNALTGSSRPPQGLTHGALVAPHQLLPAVLGLIEREIGHARAGRAAHITIKVNGLSDPEVVRALYRASREGVQVDLLVRGICTLRPGVPGQSERIRVVSVVGRFLEHSRIYRFANGGDAAHLIGSSDLRPRNLRRRVELLVPVRDPGHQARLDRILALYLEDATGWTLGVDGRYEQRPDGAPGAQEILIASPVESRTGWDQVAAPGR